MVSNRRSEESLVNMLLLTPGDYSLVQISDVVRFRRAFHDRIHSELIKYDDDNTYSFQREVRKHHRKLLVDASIK